MTAMTPDDIKLSRVLDYLKAQPKRLYWCQYIAKDTGVPADDVRRLLRLAYGRVPGLHRYKAVYIKGQGEPIIAQNYNQRINPDCLVYNSGEPIPPHKIVIDPDYRFYWMDRPSLGDMKLREPGYQPALEKALKFLKKERQGEVVRIDTIIRGARISSKAAQYIIQYLLGAGYCSKVYCVHSVYEECEALHISYEKPEDLGALGLEDDTREPYRASDLYIRTRYKIHRFPCGPWQEVHKALSIKAPFAQAVVHGPKRIENRTRRTKIPEGGMWVAVHVSKAPYKLDDEEMAHFTDLWPEMKPGRECERGVILGAMFVREVVRLEELPDENPWAFGPWCWVIEEVRALSEPIPAKGALGLWEVSDAAGEALEDLINIKF